MSDEIVQDELASLKAKADLMGVSYHPSIGVEKLREKVRAAMGDEPQEGEAKDADPVKQDGAGESLSLRRMRLKREASQLVRIRLTCLNPAKKEWPGEIIAVGNSAVGTFKKYIPFTAEEGWHVPRIIYEHLKDRQCQVFVTVKQKNGVAVRKGKLIKEFAIEVLPPLTKEELHDLAQRQAMAGASD